MLGKPEISNSRAWFPNDFTLFRLLISAHFTAGVEKSLLGGRVTAVFVCVGRDPFVRTLCE